MVYGLNRLKQSTSPPIIQSGIHPHQTRATMRLCALLTALRCRGTFCIVLASLFYPKIIFDNHCEALCDLPQLLLSLCFVCRI